MFNMFASAKRPMVSPSVIEIESLPESPTSSTRKYPNKPKAVMRSIKNAFRDAWKDIRSLQRFKSPQSRHVVVKLLLIAWNLSLLTLIGKLSSMLVLGMELDSPCHPDGDFYLGANDTLSNEFRHSNNWGNAKGFFQITLSWGNFDFTTAKLIDVAWDLVIGRGGQAIMAWVSWHVFSEYLEISIASKPATYATVWLLRFQQDASVFSTIRLVAQFFRRGLASKAAMSIMVTSLIFIFSLPTIAGSMSGYTSFNEAYMNTTDGRLVLFSTVRPVAFVIHDGNRVKDFGTDSIVPWKADVHSENGVLVSRPFDVCYGGGGMYAEKGCELQQDVARYVQLYGFNASGDKENGTSQNSTEFRGQTIDWPPLNISAFYIPSRFYFDWPSPAEPRWIENPYGDPSQIMYQVGSDVYSPDQLEKYGMCQAVKGEDSVQRYQWGFSFLQLYVVTIIMQVWSLSLMILRLKTHRTLELNNRGPATRQWKGFLEFTKTIRIQLEQAGIDIDGLQEDELEREVDKLLHGGSISSDPLSERPYTLRCWLWTNKWLFPKVAVAVVLILSEHMVRPLGPLTFLREGFITWEVQALECTPFYTLFGLIVAYSMGTTFKNGLAIFTLALLLSVPFFFYDAIHRDLTLPGLLIGVYLALGIGSTKGSRFVLFSIPFLLNYTTVLAFFLISYRDAWGVEPIARRAPASAFTNNAAMAMSR